MQVITGRDGRHHSRGWPGEQHQLYDHSQSDCIFAHENHIHINVLCQRQTLRTSRPFSNRRDLAGATCGSPEEKRHLSRCLGTVMKHHDLKLENIVASIMHDAPPIHTKGGHSHL
jgi:hypothetical protein